MQYNLRSHGPPTTFTMAGRGAHVKLPPIPAMPELKPDDGSFTKWYNCLDANFTMMKIQALLLPPPDGADSALPEHEAWGNAHG